MSTATAGSRAVFLDRDGVLVIPCFRDGRSYAPRTLEGFSLYEEAESCLERLDAAGFLLVVVTNQPDVGAGIMSAEILENMHRLLKAKLQVNAIEVCTHTAEDHCNCRKPRPGMLLRASERLGINLTRSFMVGDRASDIEAGAAAGCRTAFLDLSYSSEAPPECPDFRAKSLGAITEWILTQG
jgi:D-glycero-D-manno-heptose 1,7-bisphosphate phosphatase